MLAHVQARSSGPRSIRTRPRSSRSRALGLDPRDVRHIVVTHLDLDHAGGLADFPDAKVHLHAREHAAAMARTHVQGARALPDGALGARPEVGGLHRGRRHLARPAGGHAAARRRRRHRPVADARPHARPLGDHREAPATAGSFTPATRTSIATRSKARRERADRRSPRSSARRRSIPRARRASVAALRQLRASYSDIDLFCAHDPREYDALSCVRRRASGT